MARGSQLTPPRSWAGPTGVPRSHEPPPPWDPTVAPCQGTYGDPRGGGIFSDRVTPVGLYSRASELTGHSLDMSVSSLLYVQPRTSREIQDHANHSLFQSKHLRPHPEPRVLPHRERHSHLRVPHPVAPPTHRVDATSNLDCAEERSGRRVPHL